MSLSLMSVDGLSLVSVVCAYLATCQEQLLCLARLHRSMS